MSSVLLFAGSKRQARIRARDARKSVALQKRLDAIYAYAQTIKDETHLRQILADCQDDEARIEILKLLEPLLPFSIGKIQIADQPLPTAVGPIVLAES